MLKSFLGRGRDWIIPVVIAGLWIAYESQSPSSNVAQKHVVSSSEAKFTDEERESWNAHVKTLGKRPDN